MRGYLQKQSLNGRGIPAKSSQRTIKARRGGRLIFSNQEQQIVHSLSSAGSKFPHSQPAPTWRRECMPARPCAPGLLPQSCCAAGRTMPLGLSCGSQLRKSNDSSRVAQRDCTSRGLRVHGSPDGRSNLPNRTVARSSRLAKIVRGHSRRLPNEANQHAQRGQLRSQVHRSRDRTWTCRTNGAKG